MDISQATTGQQVTFSANTTAADIWMRTQCGAISVTYKLPYEQSEAAAFRTAAEKAGLKIEVI
jgi:hypothetical protein